MKRRLSGCVDLLSNLARTTATRLRRHAEEPAAAREDRVLVAEADHARDEREVPRLCFFPVEQRDLVVLAIRWWSARLRGVESRSMRCAAIIASLAVCIVAGCAKDPYKRLMEEAARLDRTVEARVDGFPYRAFDRNAAGDLAFRAAAAEVIASSADDYSIGVAQLVRGDTEQAIEHLSRAAEARKDARSWNALTAAHFAAASERTPSPLLDALAAADRAIEICASCPAPLFNRALILERLGLGRQASRAWRQSLRADATSAWSDEARRRLHLLVHPSSAAEFNVQRPLFETAAGHGNRRVVQEIVDRVPQQTRALAEVEYLGQWGQSLLGGDPAKAEYFLTIARAIGDALVARSGERLLRDAVNGIDTANEPRRRVIAAAHVGYRTARVAYRDGRVTEAQRGFQDALRRFEEAGSPMALVVRYYLANVQYGLNQVRQAEEELRALLAAVGDSGYRALRAQTLAQIAVCSASSGEWDAAISDYDRAIAEYAVLGEENNASFAHAALGEALSLTARPDAAWVHYATAFRIGTHAGAAQNLRLALGLAVQHEVRERAWLRALSLVRIELAEAEPAERRIQGRYTDPPRPAARAHWTTGRCNAGRGRVARRGGDDRGRRGSPPHRSAGDGHRGHARPENQSPPRNHAFERSPRVLPHHRAFVWSSRTSPRARARVPRPRR